MHYEKDFQQVVCSGAKEGGQQWGELPICHEHDASNFSDAAPVGDGTLARGFRPLRDQKSEPEPWEIYAPDREDGMNDDVNGFAERGLQYNGRGFE